MGSFVGSCHVRVGLWVALFGAPTETYAPAGNLPPVLGAAPAEVTRLLQRNACRHGRGGTDVPQKRGGLRLIELRYGRVR